MKCGSNGFNKALHVFFAATLVAAPAAGVAPACDTTVDNADDCAALAALYIATGEVLPWADGASLCSWDGVRCDASTGRVEELDLHNMLLRGSLPDELSLLSEVRRLYLWAVWSLADSSARCSG